MQSFSELPLSPQILRAVQEMGYETPSPIQAEALPILLAGDTDFLGLAGTGTGKTATFALPLLEKINPAVKGVQAIILCPTRELAVQVAGQVDLLGKYKGVRSVTIYGGASYNDQIRGLRQGAQIVVGTPGRVIDHLNRGSLQLGQVKVLVLDEADEMFSMGFKDELDAVLAAMPKEGANTWLFSATMSREVRNVVDRNLHDPKTVQVNRKEMLSSGVEQLFYRCQEYEKAEMICSLIEGADDFYGVIFCQTKALVADLSTYLVERGYKVDSLHGDKDQTSRERTMQAFRDRKLQVLVCTDVAARGLDVKDITHVINYSLPRELDSYVHRIGRTARSGKTGYAMNLVTYSHRHLLTRLEQHTKVQMKEGFAPSRRDIGAKKVAKMLPTLVEQQHGERVLEIMTDEFKAQLETMTPVDVATRFIAMMMPDVFGGEASRKTKKAEKEKSGAGSFASVAAEVAKTPGAMSGRSISSKSASSSYSAPARPSFSAPISKPSFSAPVSKPVEASFEDSTPMTPITPAARADAPPRAKSPSIRAQALSARKAPAVPAPPEAFADSEEGEFDIDEIKSLIDAPSAFGVNVEEAPKPKRAAPAFDDRASFSKPSYAKSFSERPRGGSPRSSGSVSLGRPGGAAKRVAARASAPVRPGGVAPSRGESFGSPRPAAPPRSDFSKMPRHEAGPSVASRHGETPELNRRARRAMKFAAEQTGG